METQIAKFHLFFILNQILGCSESSGGAVRLGLFFMSDEVGIMANLRSDGRVMMDLGFRKHVLSITNVFGRNYLISLR